jgi:hypothetical protein
MTPNIMQAVKDVYTEGDPMDYTWVDLGGFNWMDDVVYNKVMNNLHDLFDSDPSDVILPFESMGIVRQFNKSTLAITVERAGNAVIGTLRSKGGDLASIKSDGKEQFLLLHEKISSVEECLNKYFAGHELDKFFDSQDIDENEKDYIRRRYIFQSCSAMINHQYAEYMRRAMDIHERTRVYKALPSASNSKRIRRNKQPLFEWKVIDVTAKPATHDIVATGNGRNSPRQHKRRGHFRQYKDGHRSWIPESLVGKIEFGYIYHSYTTEKH